MTETSSACGPMVNHDVRSAVAEPVRSARDRAHNHVDTVETAVAAGTGIDVGDDGPLRPAGGLEALFVAGGVAVTTTRSVEIRGRRSRARGYQHRV